MLPKQSLNTDTILYRVQPGDSLNKIINNYYGKVPLQKRNDIIATIQADNPKLKNPDRIQANQLLQIDIPPQYCATPRAQKLTPLLNIDKALLKPLQQQYQVASPKEKRTISLLTPMMIGTGAATTMIDKTFQTNTPLVAKIAELYNEYKENKITKGQYDSGRKALLTKLKTNLGPINALLNGKKSPNEVIRISRTKGSVPTRNITQQVAKMSKLSRVASGGGFVLSIAGLGIACNQIANTSDVQVKNEIFVESVGGFAGGLIYATSATLVLAIMATPVGWVGALIIGVGGGLAGIGAGYGAKTLYTTRGNKIDLTKITKVNQLCR